MDFDFPVRQQKLVIKVKHGDTLRRFNAHVNGGDHLDLDMAGLRAKIIALFNFPPSAELTLTYIDEDGDVVALVDDDDLHDVVRQQLKFLRIDVHLSTSISGGGSTPMRSPAVQAVLPNVNAGIAEFLKSVPEPVRDVLSKLSVAASSNPLVAELVDGFSKIGPSKDGAGENTQGRSSEVPDNPFKPSEESLPNSAQLDSAKKAGHGAAIPKVARGSEVPVNFVPTGFKWSPMGFSAGSTGSHPAVGNSSRSETKTSALNSEGNKKNSSGSDGYTKGKFVGLDGSISDNGAPEYNGPLVNANTFSQCPFSGMPMPEPLFPRGPFAFGPGRRNRGPPAPGGFGMFHKGVQCDGCGSFPITGPRFKSKVKDNYDLCSICFLKMGKDSDYIRMDFPAPQFQRRPWCHKQLKDNMATFGPPFNACSSSRKVKPGWPKLDSRFILDVNVLDGTVMAPCTPFTKIWRMRNNGSLTWPHGVRLMWIGGDKFSDSTSVDLEVPLEGVPIDRELDVAVDFTAPELPGRYVSYWRLASSYGVKFGQRVWVLIQVDASLKDSTSNGISGLNLNLPPTTSGRRGSEIIDMNAEPVEEYKPDVVLEQPIKGQELDFDAMTSTLTGTNVQASAPPAAQQPAFTVPRSSSQPHSIIDEGVGSVLKGVDSVAVSYPEVEPSTVKYPMAPSSPNLFESGAVSNIEVRPLNMKDLMAPSSSNLYPIIDMSEPVSTMRSNSTSPLIDTAQGSSVDDGSGFEESLLRELEVMGFKQVDLNKEVLRMNEYDLEKSVDDLCGVNEWDPILEELQEMGFIDEEMNKKLLKKNNGSIKRVVMDLLTEGREKN